MRHHACIALGGVGIGAKSAIPALEGRLEDEDRGVRIQAAAAIRAIDPTFALHGRESLLGDAGADADEQELVRWLRALGFDRDGKPLPSQPGRR